MRIGMVLAEPYPPDARVDKEIAMLRDHGHDVCLLCYGADGRRGDERRADGVTVRSIQPLGSAMRRRLSNWWACLTFDNPFWRGHIARFAQDLSLEALHIHDLPLVGSAERVARALHLPVIADLHENYPSAVQNYYDSILKKALLYPRARWERFERRACLAADCVICVIDESKDRLVAQGIPADKIVVVANTTHPGFAELPRDPGILARYEGRFVVSYIGAINTNRDIESLIRAAASVREEIPNLLLLLVGNSPAWHESTLRELVAQQAVGDITEFTGWQPFASLPSYIAASAICTLPLRPSEQAHASGPHKFFQYGILSKPTIVSDCQSLARLARESGAALTFEALNPQSLAEAILRLYRDPELCRRLGANGRRYALEGPYGWEQTAANLAAVYDVLSRARTLPEWRTNA